MEDKTTEISKLQLSVKRLLGQEEDESISGSSEKTDDSEDVMPLDLSTSSSDKDIKLEVESIGGETEDSSDGDTVTKKKKKSSKKKGLLPNGKKTLGRVKIEMKPIKDKVRRQTTFAKRKAGLMKKTQELSILTGAECFLLVASDTGKVFTYATTKFEGLSKKAEFKTQFQECLQNTAGKAYQFAPPNSVFMSSTKAQAILAQTKKTMPEKTLASVLNQADSDGSLTSRQSPVQSSENFSPSPGPSTPTAADPFAHCPGLFLLANTVLFHPDSPFAGHSSLAGLSEKK